MNYKKRPVLTSLWKILLVLGSMFKVVWRILFHFEKMDIPARQEYMRRWALNILGILGVTLERQGVPLADQRCLRVSNHVSWLDILVLYACSPCRFIAKSEVEGYPLIGRMARNAGTLFLKRSSIKDAIRMSREISEALLQGDCVAFFPEGTTDNGAGLLPLHASLFEGAIAAQCPVQAVALRYHTSQSLRPSRDAVYAGPDSMLGTLWRIIRNGDIKALVVGLEPMPVTQQDDRRSLTARVQQQLEGVLFELTYQARLPDFAVPEQPVKSYATQVFTPVVSESEQQQRFWQDMHLLVTTGRNSAQKLQANGANRDALLDLRQSFNVFKGACQVMGHALQAQAAQVCERSMDEWLSNKKAAVPTALPQFALWALEQFENWLQCAEQGLPADDWQGDAFEPAAQAAKAV